MAPTFAVAVSGPVAIGELGIVDAHDHLFIRSPALAAGEITDPELVTREVTEARDSGVRTIVELTPIGLGRRPDLLRAVSAATGVTVIGATGFHRDAHYPAGHWVYSASPELLTKRLLDDLTVGMHPHDWLDDAPPDTARAGVIKAGASYQRISYAEQRRLEAVAAASAQTGAPIVVHTEIGTCGHDIVDLLCAAGASADRIALAHLDRNPDVDVHAEIAARGVTLVYDTIGRIKYRPDSVLLDLITEIVEAGYLGRICLGLDLGVSDYYRSYGGGPGMRSLMGTFVPRLTGRVGTAATQAMLVENPARLLATAGAGA